MTDGSLDFGHFAEKVWPMSEDWTACASTDRNTGNPLIALRLTDGAVVYLHPDIARRFAHQISIALGDTYEDQQ